MATYTRENEKYLVFEFNDDVINLIGVEAGLQMWNILSQDEKNEQYENDNEKNYYIGKYTPRKGDVPPLLMFVTAQQQRAGNSSVYTINLLTGKPTKNSQIKTIPNITLIRQIYSFQ